MDSLQLIADLSKTLRQQIDRTNIIRQLPAEALLQRPAPGKWNAVEVFEHMNLSSGVYLNGLGSEFEKGAGAFSFNSEFKPGWLGNYFTNAMRPRANGDISWRMKTMRMFDPPRNQGASTQSLDRFVQMSERFIALLNRAKRTDLNRLRVISTLGPLVRFKAGDAFRFPIAHQERHFQQIERVLASTV